MIGIKIYPKADVNIKKSISNNINTYLPNILEKLEEAKQKEIIQDLIDKDIDIFCWAGFNRYIDYLQENSKFIIISEKLQKIYVGEYITKLEDPKEVIYDCIKWKDKNWKRILFLKNMKEFNISKHVFDTIVSEVGAIRKAENQGYTQIRYIYYESEQEKIFDILGINNKTELQKFIEQQTPLISERDNLEINEDKFKKIFNEFGGIEKNKDFIFKNLMDVEHKPNYKETSSKIYERDARLSLILKEKYNYSCQICAISLEALNNKKYVEAHHIIPLSEGGIDSIKNMICVCPNCHKKFHLGSYKLNKENKKIKNTISNEESDLIKNFHL